MTISTLKIALLVCLTIPPSVIATAASEVARTSETPPAAPVYGPRSLGPGVLPAPVGHRQPRRADVSPARSERDAEHERRERALNLRLKICRGC
jgi:hypothetical protein